MTTYVQQVINQLSELLPDCDRDLIDGYAVLVLSRGTATSLEDVHSAWAVWCVRRRPNHPALVPFDELTPAVQELDRKYMEAIRQVARS